MKQYFLDIIIDATKKCTPLYEKDPQKNKNHFVASKLYITCN